MIIDAKSSLSGYRWEKSEKMSENPNSPKIPKLFFPVPGMTLEHFPLVGPSTKKIGFVC